MCYSTLLKTSWDKLELSLEISNAEEFAQKESKRVFPRQLNPVMIGAIDSSKIVDMTFSLVPSWSKTQTVKWTTYNARLERVSPKTGRPERSYQVPSWRESFGKQHCVIPMDCFYESCSERGEAKGFEVAFSQKSGPLFAAGIFSSWGGENSNHAPLLSYAIITTEPSTFIQDVGHDRMPVFLSLGNARRWISDDFENPLLAFDFLKDAEFHPDFQFDKVRRLNESPN